MSESKARKSTISCLVWIPRGVAQEHPIQYEPTQEELAALADSTSKLTMDEDDDGEGDDADYYKDDDNDDDGDDGKGVAVDEKDDDATRATAKAKAFAASLKTARQATLEAVAGGDKDDPFNMASYDDEPDGAATFLQGEKIIAPEDDPYLNDDDDNDTAASKLKGGDASDSDDDDDIKIMKDDMLVVVGKTELDRSAVELYIFQEQSESTGAPNLYVHHDFELPAFPLSLACIDIDPRGDASEHKGLTNFLAVGSFKCEIEIWNCDVMDAMEPVVVLGGRHDPDIERCAALKKAAKRDKKKERELKEALLGELKDGSHSDAIIALAWNPIHKRLASGSADTTIKIWNLTTRTCERTLTHHKGKVQSMEWNPSEPNMLLSGAYASEDRKTKACVALLDMRNGALQYYGADHFDADVECVRWSPHAPNIFLASTEAGTIFCFNAMDPSKPVFQLSAHVGACSSISCNVMVPGLFASAGLDRTVNLWLVTDDKPSKIASREMREAGSLYAMSFYPNEPFVIAAGGDKGKLAIWDTMENETVSRLWSPSLPAWRIAKAADDAKRRAVAATTTTTTSTTAPAAAPSSSSSSQTIVASSSASSTTSMAASSGKKASKPKGKK